MPRPVPNPRVALELATRTLELVDIPSESWDEAALAKLVRASVPLDARLRRRRVAALPARAGEPAARPLRGAHRHRAGAREPARPDRRRRGARARRDRHEGRARGDDRACALGGRGGELAHDPAFLFFPREEIAVEHSPLPRLFDSGLIDEAALVICSSRPTTRSSSAASATSTRDFGSTGEARTPHGRGWA